MHHLPFLTPGYHGYIQRPGYHLQQLLSQFEGSSSDQTWGVPSNPEREHNNVSGKASKGTLSCKK